MLFEDAYEEFKIYAKNRHKKQGFETITRNFNLHILPYFKGKTINKIRKVDILNWQSIILNFNFCNSFNNSLYYTFSSFYNYCILVDYVKNNIVIEVGNFVRKNEKKQYKIYNIWQFRKFRFKLDNYIYKQLFNFMFFYGTRPSEALALRFNDIKKNIVYIDFNVHRRGNRELDTPKNKSSIRHFRVSFLMLLRFYRLKKMYIKEYGCFDNYFVFGGLKPLSTTTIDRYKEKASKKANLPILKQHEFRHCYATRMISLGYPIDFVSKSMGHSRVSTTLDIYTHNDLLKQKRGIIFPLYKIFF